MGNKPSHRPFEGESPGVNEPDRGGTALGRVFGIVHGLVDGLRRRVAGDRGEGRERAARAPDAEEKAGDPDPDRREDGRVTSAATSFPRRDRPLTRPSRDGKDDNPPDLRSRTEDGRLSIYYPDRGGAEITSDTWERVDR